MISDYFLCDLWSQFRDYLKESVKILACVQNRHIFGLSDVVMRFLYFYVVQMS
jgi:hypothetical protein